MKVNSIVVKNKILLFQTSVTKKSQKHELWKSIGFFLKSIDVYDFSLGRQSCIALFLDYIIFPHVVSRCNGPLYVAIFNSEGRNSKKKNIYVNFRVFHAVIIICIITAWKALSIQYWPKIANSQDILLINPGLYNPRLSQS